MERLALNFSGSTVKLLHKLIACVVFSCIIVGSAESVTFTGINISFANSVKVSTDTLLSHFFSVSTLPVNAISKMFVETVINKAGTQTSSSQKNKDKKEKDGSSARASAGYSIIPNTTNSLSFVVRIKALNIFKDFSHVLRQKLMHYQTLEKDKIRYLDLFIKFNIILLLLYIILTRRNISGDDNIINKLNKNNTIARLV
ncbi:hypothetical protein MASR1M68_08410 [Elusimicrobiota bacterium]